MRQIFNWFSRLIKSDTAESSKRFLALYAGVILVSYLIFRFANPENLEIILGEILTFVLVLVGVAAWQNSRTKK
jgi:hypothetical protein